MYQGHAGKLVVGVGGVGVGLGEETTMLPKRYACPVVSAVWCGSSLIRKHKTQEEAELLELLFFMVTKALWGMDGKGIM